VNTKGAAARVEITYVQQLLFLPLQYVEDPVQFFFQIGHFFGCEQGTFPVDQAAHGMGDFQGGV
jgi:hypothetical protein